MTVILGKGIPLSEMYSYILRFDAVPDLVAQVFKEARGTRREMIVSALMQNNEIQRMMRGTKFETPSQTLIPSSSFLILGKLRDIASRKWTDAPPFRVSMPPS